MISIVIAFGLFVGFCMWQRLIRGGMRTAVRWTAASTAVRNLPNPLLFQQTRYIHFQNSDEYNELCINQPTGLKQDVLSNQIQTIHSFDEAVLLTHVHYFIGVINAGLSTSVFGGEFTYSCRMWTLFPRNYVHPR